MLVAATDSNAGFLLTEKSARSAITIVRALRTVTMSLGALGLYRRVSVAGERSMPRSCGLRGGSRHRLAAQLDDPASPRRRTAPSTAARVAYPNRRLWRVQANATSRRAASVGEATHVRIQLSRLPHDAVARRRSIRLILCSPREQRGRSRTGRTVRILDRATSDLITYGTARPPTFDERRVPVP